MKTERKIAMVVNHVRMEDEDGADVSFWLNRSPADRLAEVARLRRNYFTWVDGSFPPKNRESYPATPAMIFERDFIDFIELLNQHQVA